MPRSVIKVCVPRATPRSSTSPATPPPVIDSKLFAALILTPRSVAPSTIAPASGCSLPRSRLAALLEGLERLGVLDQDSRARAHPGADHDRHRRREPESARARDDQNGNGGEQGVGHAWVRSDERPDDEGHYGDGDDRRDKVRGDGVGQALDRSPASLGFTHHGDDPRQESVGADALRPHDEGARAVDGASGHRIADLFLHGKRLAGDHRLVDGALAVEHLAVHGDLLAGPDSQPVADRDVLKRNVLFRAAVVHHARGARRQAEKRPDRFPGTAARA
jgi:hypothetical protein